MKLFLSTLTLLVLFCSCDNTQKQRTAISNSEWLLLYKSNGNGDSVYGDKAKLIHAVRKGYPIRVGWASRRTSDTTKSVEHVVDATFLTIANQQEVFAQITPFWAQRPDLTSDTLSMTALPSQSSWLLGTNGVISSVGVDHVKDSVKSYPPGPFRYGLSWFAQVPNKNWENTAIQAPLWD